MGAYNRARAALGMRTGTGTRTKQRVSQIFATDQMKGYIREEEARLLKIADEGRLTAQRVLEEIARIAFSDPGALFTEKGNLRPVHELPPEVRATIASVEVVHRNLTAGDGTIDVIHKLKSWDKPKALEMLAKHFALLTEKVEHSGAVEFTWRDSE